MSLELVTGKESSIQVVASAFYFSSPPPQVTQKEMALKRNNAAYP